MTQWETEGWQDQELVADATLQVAQELVATEMYIQECQKNFFWYPHLYNFVTAYLMLGKEFQYKSPYNCQKYQLTNPLSYMMPVQERPTEDTETGRMDG